MEAEKIVIKERLFERIVIVLSATKSLVWFEFPSSGRDNLWPRSKTVVNPPVLLPKLLFMCDDPANTNTDSKFENPAQTTVSLGSSINGDTVFCLSYIRSPAADRNQGLFDVTAAPQCAQLLPLYLPSDFFSR